jgi:hypothetical protein
MSGMFEAKQMSVAQKGDVMTACMVFVHKTGQLSFVQDSRHQPRASPRKHDMTSGVGFCSDLRRRSVDTTNSKSIANLESCAVFSVESQGYWNEVGTRCSASVGILGLLALHMLHPERVSKSHHSRGRAAGWPLHRCSLLGPAGGAVKAFQFCRTVAVFCKPRARPCRPGEAEKRRWYLVIGYRGLGRLLSSLAIMLFRDFVTVIL